MMDYNLDKPQIISGMLMLSYRTLMNHLSKTFNEQGFTLTPEQYSVLICLFQNGDAQQNSIAKMLNRDQTSVSRMINVMVRSGLLIREGHATDKRANIIRPTQKALEMRQVLFDSSKAAISEVFESFSESEIEVLMRMLERIINWKE